jgi:hypothetical protein
VKVKTKENLIKFNKALVEGCRAHGFRSGGGLRVVSLEKDGKSKGYGEHPNIEEALVHAGEDYVAGGRRYCDVYGRLHNQYLTGSCDASSDLDAWLLKGHSFDAWREGESIVVQLEGLRRTRTPDNVIDSVKATGEPVRWKSRGFTYETSQSRLPNGEPSFSSRVVSGITGYNADAWMYPIAKTGHGRDFQEALVSAFGADEVEQ